MVNNIEIPATKKKLKYYKLNIRPHTPRFEIRINSFWLFYYFISFVLYVLVYFNLLTENKESVIITIIMIIIITTIIILPTLKSILLESPVSSKSFSEFSYLSKVLFSYFLICSEV